RFEGAALCPLPAVRHDPGRPALLNQVLQAISCGHRHLWHSRLPHHSRKRTPEWKCDRSPAVAGWTTPAPRAWPTACAGMLLRRRPGGATTAHWSLVVLSGPAAGDPLTGKCPELRAN